MPGTEQKVWYAMRATYGRNLEAKKSLDEVILKLESYGLKLKDKED